MAGIVEGDYRRDGSKQLITCSVDGEVGILKRFSRTIVPCVEGLIMIVYFSEISRFSCKYWSIYACLTLKLQNLYLIYNRLELSKASEESLVKNQL